MGLIEQIEELATASGYSFSYGEEDEQNYNVDLLDIENRPVLALLPMVSSGEYENGQLLGREVSAVVSLGIKGGGEAPAPFVGIPRWATFNGVSSEVTLLKGYNFGEDIPIEFRFIWRGADFVVAGSSNQNGYAVKIKNTLILTSNGVSYTYFVTEEPFEVGREYTVRLNRIGAGCSAELDGVFIGTKQLPYADTLTIDQLCKSTTVHYPAELAWVKIGGDKYEFFSDDCRLGGYDGESIPSIDITTGAPVDGVEPPPAPPVEYSAQSTRDETRREKHDNRLAYLSGALKDFINKLAQLDGLTMNSDHIIEKVNKYDANLEFVVAEITFDYEEAPPTC